MMTAMQAMALGIGGDQHTLTRIDQRTCEGGKTAGSRVAREQVCGTHGLVVSGRMVFGKIIGPIHDAGPPEDVILALPCVVAYPIESHVQSF